MTPGVRRRHFLFSGRTASVQQGAEGQTWNPLLDCERRTCRQEGTSVAIALFHREFLDDVGASSEAGTDISVTGFFFPLSFLPLLVLASDIHMQGNRPSSQEPC